MGGLMRADEEEWDTGALLSWLFVPMFALLIQAERPPQQLYDAITVSTTICI